MTFSLSCIPTESYIYINRRSLLLIFMLTFYLRGCAKIHFSFTFLCYISNIIHPYWIIHKLMLMIPPHSSNWFNVHALNAEQSRSSKPLVSLESWARASVFSGTHISVCLAVCLPCSVWGVLPRLACVSVLSEPELSAVLQPHSCVFCLCTSEPLPRTAKTIQTQSRHHMVPAENVLPKCLNAKKGWR